MQTACKKCLHTIITTKYDQREDKLNRTCAMCGFEWKEFPADSTLKDRLERIRQEREDEDDRRSVKI